MAYKLRKTSISYRICLHNSSCSKLICFGEILFFFSYRDDKFFFVKQILCSSSLSNRLNLDDSVDSWPDRIINIFIVFILLQLSFIYILVLLYFENRFFFHLMVILFLHPIMITNSNMIKCEKKYSFYIFDYLMQVFYLCVC